MTFFVCLFCFVLFLALFACLQELVDADAATGDSSLYLRHDLVRRRGDASGFRHVLLRRHRHANRLLDVDVAKMVGDCGTHLSDETSGGGKVRGLSLLLLLLFLFSLGFMSVSLSVCLSICPSVCQSACLSVFLSVRLSFCRSVRLSVCLSVCLYPPVVESHVVYKSGF